MENERGMWKLTETMATCCYVFPPVSGITVGIMLLFTALTTWLDFAPHFMECPVNTTTACYSLLWFYTHLEGQSISILNTTQ